MISFDHRTYTRLLKNSSILAKKYRIDCGLEKPEVKVVEKIFEIKELKKVKDKEEIKEEKLIEEKIEYNSADLRKILKEGGIKFFPGAKTDKLLEICIKNKLI